MHQANLALQERVAQLEAASAGRDHMLRQEAMDAHQAWRTLVSQLPVVVPRVA